MPQIADVAMRAVLLPLLLAALPAAAATAEPNFALVDPPKALPDVRFMDGEGRNAALTDFRGKVVLLNVWATWCLPCRREMPTFDRLQGALGAFDTLYYHEYKARLPGGVPGTAPELVLHGLRDLIYAVLFGTLALEETRPAGWIGRAIEPFQRRITRSAVLPTKISRPRCSSVVSARRSAGGGTSPFRRNTPSR